MKTRSAVVPASHQYAHGALHQRPGAKRPMSATTNADVASAHASPSHSSPRQVPPGVAAIGGRRWVGEAAAAATTS